MREVEVWSKKGRSTLGKLWLEKSKRCEKEATKLLLSALKKITTFGIKWHDRGFSRLAYRYINLKKVFLREFTNSLFLSDIVTLRAVGCKTFVFPSDFLKYNYVFIKTPGQVASLQSGDVWNEVRRERKRQLTDVSIASTQKEKENPETMRQTREDEK